VMEADAEVVRNNERGMLRIAAAKKLDGQPDHPINHGGLCPRGQAAIQITYHPDRVTQPLKRKGNRGSGDFTPVSWDEAIGEFVSKLDAIAAAGDQKSIAFVTRPRRSRRAALIAEFASKLGAPAPILFDPMGDEVVRRANAISFGHEQLATIDLARSRFVISFGADLLGTWNSPVAQSAGYGAMRQGHPQQRGKLAVVESRMSITGANADEWVPVKPGTEGVLALGLAHVIVANKLRPSGSGRAAAAIDGWSGGLADYAPARVEQITGVAAKRIERLARELVDFRPAVAVAGGPAVAHSNGLFHALAVNALNDLLGAVEQPGGIFFTPGGHSPLPNPQSLQNLGAAKLVVIDEANPVYAAPAALKVRETFEQAPFIVSFGSFVDDTSAYADLILPDHTFLESWVDTTPESGSIEAVTTVAGPVMKPLHQTRATADVLIEVAGKLKAPIALPWKTAEELAKSPVSPQPPAPAPAREAAKYAEPRFEGDAAQFPFHFLPFKTPQFGDGSTAHLPWLQEMPDPLTSAMWSSWVEINPATAERLQIAQGDLVDITSPHGTLRAPAMIFPAIAPDVIAMPIGQGHVTFTQYASGRGVNPMAILAPATEAATGALAWAATRVKIARAGPADRSLIMFAGEMRERPHEGEIR